MRILAVIALAIGLAGCPQGQGVFKQIPNPASKQTLYEAELVFDGSLKTFNKLKSLCAARTLPPACRTYVVKGQEIIVKVYAADKAARDFVKNNPTLDATNVIQAVTNLVSTFNGTVQDLSAVR